MFQYRTADTDEWAAFLALDDAAQLSRVLDAMADIVAEVGADYVYPYKTCSYVTPYGERDDDADKGAPCCLIGRVCYRLGAGLDTLARWDNEGDAGIEQINAGHLMTDDGHLRQRTVHAMKVAQNAQDGYNGTERRTWGEALYAARHVADITA